MVRKYLGGLGTANGAHACLGCLLYPVAVFVLYNVDTFIFIKQNCKFFAIFRSLHLKVVDLERTAIYGRSMSSLY
jgi:hypothetical protein